MIIDIHTHKPYPQPDAVVDISPRAPRACTDIAATGDGQPFSAGFHPWDTIGDFPEECWSALENLLRRPDAVAVGECGIDLSGRGGMLFRQMQIFRRQMELADSLMLPMIIHCVKADDIICGLIRDYRPATPWVIHGFRKKTATARQLLRAGCYISFGPIFNEETVKEIPLDRILAETDDSGADIHEVIRSLSRARGLDLLPVIAENTERFLFSSRKNIFTPADPGISGMA